MTLYYHNVTALLLMQLASLGKLLQDPAS
jgi:hypothetical protein